MEAGELFLGAVLSKAPHAAHEALLTLLPLPVQSRGKTRYRNHPGRPPGTRINSDVGNGMPRNPVPNPGDQPYSSSARTAVFDRWSDGHCPTEARANWSDRFVRPVPAGPVRPVPGTDRTGLSDPPAGASVGQCLSDHQSNTAVRAPLELPCSTG
ncbi:hypothetical protein PCANC_17808 [Puccinia coronata f. sp. avenae]|uniref:Uncharacterized protein n=1 Tax=Puccinia coronata f. sp. avenae TaxID=200324 RepID=A0A2N5SI88_9BASI|nr:hypothetical protein PCANC_17808 [Puccinia coronata f. sp. avenae]